jgi:hypothetical protein
MAMIFRRGIPASYLLDSAQYRNDREVQVTSRGRHRARFRSDDMKSLWNFGYMSPFSRSHSSISCQGAMQKSMHEPGKCLVMALTTSSILRSASPGIEAPQLKHLATTI